MPISGLMLTLANDEALANQSVMAMENESAIELGLRDGLRVAAVLDTESEDENRRLWRWLNQLPGVVHTDVVFVSLEDAAASHIEDLPVEEVSST